MVKIKVDNMNLQQIALSGQAFRWKELVQNTSTTTATMIDNFDATFYANMYPDVKKAIGTDATKLYNHYVTYGKAEGRYANQTAYNAAHKSK